jgi:hypothetical protein
MFRLSLLCLVFLLSTTLSFAGDASTKIYNTLKDSSGTALSDYSLTSGVAVFSESILVDDNIGFTSLLIQEDQGGGTGDVDISVQYSMDGTNWHTAYTSDMAGTITAEGNIVTGLQNVTRWIVHTSRLAKWMRYKFDPDANSEITAIFIYQRDR